MSNKFRSLLFSDPDYKITNISKFMEGVEANHGLALMNLSKVEENIGIFKAACPSGLPGLDSVVEDILYVMERLNLFLSTKIGEGFIDRDGIVFVNYLLGRYHELVAHAVELDGECGA